MNSAFFFPFLFDFDSEFGDEEDCNVKTQFGHKKRASQFERHRGLVRPAEKYEQRRSRHERAYVCFSARLSEGTNFDVSQSTDVSGLAADYVKNKRVTMLLSDDDVFLGWMDVMEGSAEGVGRRWKNKYYNS